MFEFDLLVYSCVCQPVANHSISYFFGAEAVSVTVPAARLATATVIQ